MARARSMTILVADGEPRPFAGVLDALTHARGLQPGAKIGIDGGEDAELVAGALSTRAQPGQVLVSDAVRSLAVPREGFEFREVGALDLDGDGGSVHAWELLWQESGPRTRIRLCGPLALDVDGRDLTPGLPGGQASALLAFLATQPERTASRDELIAVAWPRRAPQDPQAAVRPILSRLRRALAPAELEGRQRIRLVLPEPVWVDADEAAATVEAARLAAKGGSWESVRDQARAAIELLAPGFLPGQEGEWVDARRREIEDLRLEALELAARGGLALGGTELARAERASRELISRSPYRETGHRFLMEALAASGNVAEALRAYEELRVLLREELGTAPAPEVQEIHRRLLAGEPSRQPAASPSPAPAPAATAADRPRAPLPAALSPRERSAIVGRDPELGELRAAWAEARSGSRRLVLVAGEPGIGKTRLMSELAGEAQESGTVLYAGCQEEALVSYQPFVEALRHYARSSEVPTVVPGAGAIELARLIPELSATLPTDGEAAPKDPDTRRYLLFEAVSALIAEASSRTPLLLVLDDLHWADRATLHLLRHLIRAPEQASLLVVGAYREAEVGPEHPLADVLADLRRDRLFQRISLDGLDQGGVRDLIALHAGNEAPPALVGTVHERTEGNPFFVDEVMRHLIETGVLFERDGRWSSALTADEIGVPEGVREVLGGRLARLSEGCREALSAGAVLGREFEFEVLLEMGLAEEEALIAALEEGLDAQLVVETAREAGTGYGFTHALVREVLYGELSGPRRQRMHARAARAIEATSGDPSVAALAVHYRLAGPAGDLEKAIEYSLRAGAQATELLAWDEAAAHWEGALTAMTAAGGREEERARLQMALGDVMAAAGDLGRQIEHLERALAQFEALGDEQRAAQAHSRLGMAHSLIDSVFADHLDINVAFRHFDAAREVLDRGEPTKALGHLETGISTGFTYGVQTQRGIDAARRAMEIAERVGDEVSWAAGAQACGWHLIVAGEQGEGFETLERSIEVVDRERRSFLTWMGLNIRGQMSWGLHSPDEAQVFFERLHGLGYVGRTSYRKEAADAIGRCHILRGETEEARRLLSDARPAWITHSLKPLVDLWDGRWDEALSLANQVLETSRRNGNRWDEWASQHLAARVLRLDGDTARAAESLERALTIVTEGGAVCWELWVRLEYARVEADRGRLGEARAHADRCLEIVTNGEDWRGRAGQAHLADAVVLALEDEMDEAAAAFTRALESLERYRLLPDSADALHQWGRALTRAGATTEATEKLDQALAIYRDRDAGAAWVERVEAAVP
jgi:DNA-binding SARP family transcriptional activator/tetratricopeptide (TPR) repeat protein